MVNMNLLVDLAELGLVSLVFYDGEKEQNILRKGMCQYLNY